MSRPQSQLAQHIKEYLRNGTLNRIRQAEFAEMMNVSEQTVSKWVRSLSYPSNEKPFIEKLGWTPELVRKCRDDYENHFLQTSNKLMQNKQKLRQPELKSSNHDYQVISFSDYLANFGDTHSLDKETDAIINYFPIPEREGNDMGDNETWRRLYTLSSDTGCVLVDNLGTILGFWFIVLVTPNLYKRTCCGENINKELCIYDIQTVGESGCYDVYFTDFFIHPAHFSPLSKQLLFNKFFDLLKALVDIGIYINRMAANITTDLAENFCIHRGFKFLCNHQTHLVNLSSDDLVPSKIYELDFNVDGGRAFFKKNSYLKEKYRSKFVPDGHIT